MGIGENGEFFEFLKGFPYKPTIADGWFIRKSFKDITKIPIFTYTPQLPRGVSQRSGGVVRTSWAFYDSKLGEVSISNIFRGVWKIKNPP